MKSFKTYNDRQSTFEELIDEYEYFRMHHQNLQVLATEMYKAHSNSAPYIMNVNFLKKEILYYLKEQGGGGVEWLVYVSKWKH